MRIHRRLSVAVAVAIVAAACGGGGGSTTTTAAAVDGPDTTQTTVEDTPETTAAVPGEVSIEQDCVPADGYPGPACANYADAESLPQNDSAFPILGEFLFDSLSCIAFPDHVFAFPDNDAFIPANLEPITVDDLAEIGIADAESVIAYLDEVPLGLFRITDDADLFEVIADIETGSAGSVMASPHYLLTPTPTWKYGPHGVATRIPGDFGDLGTTGVSGADRRVVIMDTGTTGDPTVVGIGPAEPELNVDPFVAGHGSFAASIARQFNPELEIAVYNAAGGGLLSEASIIDALQRSSPASDEVVNLSLGTYPCTGEDPTLGLIQVLSTLPEGVEVVAASGNDGIDPMLPASLGFEPQLTTPEQMLQFELFAANGIDLNALSSRITAVGALDREGNMTSWSNGAELYAPGEHVVGWYHDGSEASLAVWSGTSFAAPHFAACLASGVCTAP